MVNAGVVNGGSVCLNHADFCENLLVFGRFLHFKKPVKYNGKSRVNRISGRLAGLPRLLEQKRLR